VERTTFVVGKGRSPVNLMLLGKLRHLIGDVAGHLAVVPELRKLGDQIRERVVDANLVGRPPDLLGDGA
jgi:hypothetical protein